MSNNNCLEFLKFSYICTKLVLIHIIALNDALMNRDDGSSDYFDSIFDICEDMWG